MLFNQMNTVSNHKLNMFTYPWYIDGLSQDFSNFNDNALNLLQSCLASNTKILNCNEMDSPVNVCTLVVLSPKEL